jgi:hypothetical protein
MPWTDFGWEDAPDGWSPGDAAPEGSENAELTAARMEAFGEDIHDKAAATAATAANTALTAHTGDATAAHAASAISVAPTGGISATTAQAALAELDSEKQAVSAKGQANGYASLGSDGLVPDAQLPSAQSGSAMSGRTTRELRRHSRPRVASFTGGAAKFGSGGRAGGVYTVGTPMLEFTGAVSGGALGTGTIEAWFKSANPGALKLLWGAGRTSLTSGTTRRATRCWRTGSAIRTSQPASTFVMAHGITSRPSSTSPPARHHLRGRRSRGDRQTRRRAARMPAPSLSVGSSTPTSFDTAIDELRISKVARYTGTTYTTPSAPFTSDSDTIALYHLESDFTNNVGGGVARVEHGRARGHRHDDDGADAHLLHRDVDRRPDDHLRLPVEAQRLQHLGRDELEHVRPPGRRRGHERQVHRHRHQRRRLRVRGLQHGQPDLRRRLRSGEHRRPRGHRHRHHRADALVHHGHLDRLADRLHVPVEARGSNISGATSSTYVLQSRPTRRRDQVHGHRDQRAGSTAADSNSVTPTSAGAAFTPTDPNIALQPVQLGRHSGAGEDDELGRLPARPDHRRSRPGSRRRSTPRASRRRRSSLPRRRRPVDEREPRRSVDADDPGVQRVGQAPRGARRQGHRLPRTGGRRTPRPSSSPASPSRAARHRARRSRSSSAR